MLAPRCGAHKACAEVCQHQGFLQGPHSLFIVGVCFLFKFFSFSGLNVFVQDLSLFGLFWRFDEHVDVVFFGAGTPTPGSVLLPSECLRHPAVDVTMEGVDMMYRPFQKSKVVWVLKENHPKHLHKSNCACLTHLCTYMMASNSSTFLASQSSLLVIPWLACFGCRWWNASDASSPKDKASRSPTRKKPKKPTNLWATLMTRWASASYLSQDSNRFQEVVGKAQQHCTGLLIPSHRQGLPATAQRSPGNRLPKQDPQDPWGGL